jgi:hypothetical protein
MTSVRSRITLAVLVSLLVFLPACNRHVPVKGEGPFYIMLVYNGGSCQQNGSMGTIDVPQDQPIIYQGATALSNFQIELQRCPFAAVNCPVNSPNGNSVNVGAPVPGSANTTFPYSAMTINGQACTDGAQMAIRVRGGP